ncbi:response regulator [Noviherbaspirillum sp. 17J57-3]|uniref:Response regulator n=2 Tax=Noviherbaspirillum galbum TaxID=2709383 RepID=A0A6B3SNM4_9BURK|nr:response regulator [Noviherbaspirillum galbum]
MTPDTPLKTILYVEDDADIRAVAKIALEIVGGFSLHVCSGGSEAVSAIEQGIRPDLVLLDVMMPGMDGPTTLKALRAFGELASTPVIFMTAKVQPREVEQYQAMGAIGVIAKPFNPMTLAQQVRKLWEDRNGA